MLVHYLEIVTPEVDDVCAGYEASLKVKFGEPDPFLGGARTCIREDGSMVGVRAPMRADEAPVARPYWLVDDINIALEQVVQQGAVVAMPRMEIPGKGFFAIYILGGTDQGFWEL